jgi:hypothetical protein
MVPLARQTVMAAVVVPVEPMAQMEKQLAHIVQGAVVFMGVALDSLVMAEAKVLVVLALFVSFTQPRASLAPSHQQIQETFNA